MDLAGVLLDHGLLLIGENWLFLLVVVAAMAVPRRVTWPERLDRFAARRFVWMLVFAVSLAVSLGKVARDGVTLPRYHDDFGYLLAADTFAHGHVSYPTHPFADHFETMHVLQRPRYVAKFPPGQGLLLTGGMTAVWLMTAAACAALWWALRVWLGPRLALIGGLAAALHPTMLRWSQAYTAGALAAFAGALLFGAVGVLRARSSWRAASLAGVALALLAVSRPFEGLVLAVALLIISKPRLDREHVRAHVIGAITALVALVPLALYNRAITGSAFTLPYSIYEKNYDPVPNFVFERPNRVTSWPNQEMTYNYKVVYYGYYLRELARPIDGIAKKVDVIRYALFGPESWLPAAWCVLLLPLVAMPRALARRREARLLVLAMLLFAFAPFSVTWWLQLHYLAPATALAAAFILVLWDELVSMRRGGLLATAVLAVFLVNAIGAWCASPQQPGFEPQRQAIGRSLVARGGQHVVFVAPDVFDAVYNGGDIDAQPVVWARDLGSARNDALRAYYKNRGAWRLTRRDGRVTLSAY
ncbi:MAG: hypothetical protein ACRD3J_03680 [Thermoanaerobaculia bacterium]